MIRPASGLRTLWYMGSKARIISEFIDAAIHDLSDPGETLVDLCAGTAVVARSLAERHPVIANDVQRFSAIIARAHLEGDEGWWQALEHLDPEADLGRVLANNLGLLTRLAPTAVALEERALTAVIEELASAKARRAGNGSGRGHGDGDEGADTPAGTAEGVDGNPCAADSYRAFLEATPELADPEADETTAPDAGGASRHLFEPLRTRHLGLLRERRRDPDVLPFSLVTLYYSNIYFGLRQAMMIDSYRAAIARIPDTDPFRQRKQALYLAALLYAASVSTSGTSHFAQPRSLRKDSELLAVARRRATDIESEFHIALDAIRREWGMRNVRHHHRVYELEAERLLAVDGPLAGEEIGLVYVDPPYTADNYSRFYHLLEILVDYDYPELERRGGRLTRGRYPVREKRYQSRFCRADAVEGAFREVVERVHALGSRLVVSYSAEAGLLFKRWRREGETDPLGRFYRLFRDRYSRVEIRRRPLLHSGQGDSNRQVEELLILCER